MATQALLSLGLGSWQPKALPEAWLVNLRDGFFPGWKLHLEQCKQDLGSVWKGRCDWGLCEGHQNGAAVAAISEDVNSRVQEGLKIEN